MTAPLITTLTELVWKPVLSQLPSPAASSSSPPAPGRGDSLDSDQRPEGLLSERVTGPGSQGLAGQTHCVLGPCGVHLDCGL